MDYSILSAIKKISHILNLLGTFFLNVRLCNFSCSVVIQHLLTTWRDWTSCGALVTWDQHDSLPCVASLWFFCSFALAQSIAPQVLSEYVVFYLPFRHSWLFSPTPLHSFSPRAKTTSILFVLGSWRPLVGTISQLCYRSLQSHSIPLSQCSSAYVFRTHRYFLFHKCQYL